MTDHELIALLKQKYLDQWQSMIKLFWVIQIYPASFSSEMIRFLEVVRILYGDQWLAKAALP